MEQTVVENKKISEGRWLTVCLLTFAAIASICALALTFTVGDYYIFSRMGRFGVLFCLCQWIKKAGLLLIALAVFFNCKSCANAVKYALPLFIIISCFTYGNFFDATPEVAAGDINGEIFNSINTFFPKTLNMVLFFAENVALAMCCALLFARDGFKIEAKSLITLPQALLLAMPLNLFENFFDVNTIPKDSFLRFYNFTIWHFIALAVLVGVTVGLYYFLKNKPRQTQDKYLAALAVCLLIQYHSKDSLLLSDGYNVYNTVFAVLPLFICNVGVYVACLSVFFKRKALYSISFFIHAIGALTVFIYFGKNEMSNYGIFCSYSILYFCVTHCILFALCVMPSALGHFKFKVRECWIPLVYYFIVIIISSIASTLISDASTRWVTADGQHLIYDGVYVQGEIEGSGGLGYMKPNFAFTQTNPLPFSVPNLIPLGGAFAYINLFYVILVYGAYVLLFFAFYGAYEGFLAVRRAVLKMAGKYVEKVDDLAPPEPIAEAAATDDNDTDDTPAEVSETNLTYTPPAEVSETELTYTPPLAEVSETELTYTEGEI